MCTGGDTRRGREVLPHEESNLLLLGAGTVVEGTDWKRTVRNTDSTSRVQTTHTSKAHPTVFSHASLCESGFEFYLKTGVKTPGQENGARTAGPGEWRQNARSRRTEAEPQAQNGVRTPGQENGARTFVPEGVNICCIFLALF